MKVCVNNLLTKTLFISLLLSAAIPSGLQADFSTADVKKFAKEVSRTAVFKTAVGVVAGVVVGEVSTILIVNKKVKKI